MFAKITLGLFLSFAAIGAAVADQRYVNVEERLTPEQMRATGLDGLSKAQLELLNRLLGEDTAKVVQAAKAEEAQVQEEKHAKAQQERVAQAEAAAQEGRAGSLLGLDDKPVKSRLKGSVSGWEPGTVFELENGQQWKVLKGSLKLRKTLESPEVLVVGGVAGRFFLQVDEDMPKARVYLIN